MHQLNKNSRNTKIEVTTWNFPNHKPSCNKSHNNQKPQMEKEIEFPNLKKHKPFYNKPQEIQTLKKIIKKNPNGIFIPQSLKNPIWNPNIQVTILNFSKESKQEKKKKKSQTLLQQNLENKNQTIKKTQNGKEKYSLEIALKMMVPLSLNQWKKTTKPLVCSNLQCLFLTKMSRFSFRKKLSPSVCFQNQWGCVCVWERERAFFGFKFRELFERKKEPLYKVFIGWKWVNTHKNETI